MGSISGSGVAASQNLGWRRHRPGRERILVCMMTLMRMIVCMMRVGLEVRRRHGHVGDYSWGRLRQCGRGCRWHLPWLQNRFCTPVHLSRLLGVLLGVVLEVEVKVLLVSLRVGLHGAGVAHDVSDVHGAVSGG